MGCSWFNTKTNKRKTSINNKNIIKYIDKKSPAKNLQISSCSNSITCMDVAHKLYLLWLV